MRFGALITARHLAEQLFKSPNNIRVIDASYFLPNTGMNAYEIFKKEHIPGAQFFDIDVCMTKSDYEHMLPTASDFEKYVGALGIDNNTHVVVYNNHPKFSVFSAPRVWWTFRVFGHNMVSVLDGGLRSWKNEQYEVTSKTEQQSTKEFKATYVSSLVKTFEDVLANIHSKQFQLVDARPPGRFNGTEPEPRKECKPGHIPGATNIPFMAIQGPCTNPDQSVLEKGAVLPVEQLKEVFKNYGIDLSQPLVASCGSGVTACNVAFAAYLCGKEDVAVYDGAWVEWYKRSNPDQRSACPED